MNGERKRTESNQRSGVETKKMTPTKPLTRSGDMNYNKEGNNYSSKAPNSIIFWWIRTRSEPY